MGKGGTGTQAEEEEESRSLPRFVASSSLEWVPPPPPNFGPFAAAIAQWGKGYYTTLHYYTARHGSNVPMQRWGNRQNRLRAPMTKHQSAQQIGWGLFLV